MFHDSFGVHSYTPSTKKIEKNGEGGVVLVLRPFTNVQQFFLWDVETLEFSFCCRSKLPHPKQFLAQNAKAKSEFSVGEEGKKSHNTHPCLHSLIQCRRLVKRWECGTGGN